MSQDAVEPETSLDLGALKPSHVLVVGADVGMEGVSSIEWATFPDVNIKDFHLVILCPGDGIPGGQELQLLASAAKSISKEVVDEFLRSSHRELVFAGLTAEDGLPIPVYPHLSYLHAPRFEGGGTNITEVDDEFASYLGNVDRYVWTVPNGIAKHQEHPRMSYRPLAKAAGYDVIAGAYRSQRHCRVVVLPRPTLCSIEEGVVTLLVDNYGVHIGPAPRPKWLDEESLPVVDKLRSESTEAQHAVGDAVSQLQRINNALDEAEEDLSILYEKGHTLEIQVRRVLRALGARVDEPDNPRGGHDGTGRTPNDEQIVLEIKGRTKSIGLTDVRQLDQWVTDLAYGNDDREPAEWKGILIGNAHADQAPKERDAPFAHNAVAFAERRDLALMTTADLLDAVSLLQTGEFEPETWWARVMSTNGEFQRSETSPPGSS